MAELSPEIKAQIKQLLEQNTVLKEQNETLKKELDTSLGVVNKVLRSILTEGGGLDMKKVMGLITNPSKLEKDISELMQILKKHGGNKGEA